MVIQKEWQKRKFAFERELKVTEAAPEREGALETVRETSVVEIDDEDDGIADTPAVED